ncbi:MAG: hypothetical protein ACRDZ3_18120 [Acidimicrobiia bacterium]
MVLVDEFLAIRVISGSRPAGLGVGPVRLTYGRTYRLTRALSTSGAGRLQVRGRFTRLVEALGDADRRVLDEWLANPDPSVLSIIDPRAFIRMAAALQNTYAISLLQAETLAAAAGQEAPIRFGDPDSAPAPVQRAVRELGLDLAILTG